MELKFLDGEDLHRRIHDWDEHQGWLIHSEKRSEVAKRGAEARWSKSQGSEMRGALQAACDRHARGNAPTQFQPQSQTNSIPAPTPAPAGAAAGKEIADATWQGKNCEDELEKELCFWCEKPLGPRLEARPSTRSGYWEDGTFSRPMHKECLDALRANKPCPLDAKQSSSPKGDSGEESATVEA